MVKGDEMTYERAKKIVLTKYSDSKVCAGFETASGFVFSIKPSRMKDDEYVLDGTFVVEKSTGEVKEYSPVMDPEEWKHGLKNRIE